MITWIFLVLLPFQEKQVTDPAIFLDSGWYYHQEGLHDLAIAYYQQTIKNSELPENAVYRAYAAINLGNLHGSKGDYDSAIFYNEKAIQDFIQLKNVDQHFSCLVNIAECYNDIGRYQTALSYLEEAELVLSTLNDHKKSYLLLITKGRSWEELEAYDKALNNYRLARKVSADGFLGKEKNAVLISLGNLHLRLNQLDSAQPNFLRALKGSLELGDTLRMAMALNNLGEVALRNGKHTEAENYLLKAIELKRAVNPEKLPTSHYRLGAVYLELGDLALSKMYIDSALVSKNFEVQFGSRKVLKKFFKQTRQFEDALCVMETIDSMRNEQFNSERLAAQKLQASYDLEEASSELEKQKLLTQNQKLINYIIVGLILIVVVVAIVFYTLYQKNRKLSNRNELLLKEQNHRVKNNLQMITSLSSLQAKKVENNEVLKVLNESQSRLNSVALVHRMLYRDDEISSVQLRDYLEELTEELRHTSDRVFTVSLAVEAIELEIDKATSLGLIVSELIINSVKHALSENDLQIKIRASADAGKLQFEYLDNGTNFDSGKWEKGTSFGNQLIRIQVNQLRGKSTFVDLNSFHLVIDFAT